MQKNNAPDLSSKSLFKKLALQAVSRHYGNGKAIFSQGDTANSMFRIEHGNVKLAVASRKNNKAAIAILRAGDCFGEGCLIDNSLRTYTATSIKQCTIGRISKRAIIHRLHEEPAFAKLFTSFLLHRIGRVEDNLADQLLNTSEERLARLLLQIADYSKNTGKGHAVVSVDQGSLAQVVGTTRSRVSYFMNQFRKKGLIDYNGNLHVHKALLTFLVREKGSK